MSQFFRTNVQIEIDRERLIDDYLAFVRNPRSQERQAAIRSGPLPRDLLEVLALEGGTTRAAVTRVVQMLDAAKPVVRLDFAP